MCLTKKKQPKSNRQINHVENFEEQPALSGEIVSVCSEPEEVPVDSIQTGVGRRPPYSVPAVINDFPIPIRLEIDTGSAVTILTKSDFDKLGARVSSLSPPTIRMIGFSGATIPCLGESTFPVTINGQTLDVLLRVVNVSGPSLLGRDILSVFQLQ